MSNFIKVDLTLRSAQELDITTAILADHDFYAFEQEENHLRGYIRESDFDEIKLNSILPFPCPFTVELLGERNWNEEWEKGMKPVRIHDFAGIRTAFQPPLEEVRHEIIITPKMSFGTGHHPSTSLMIAQMERVDFRGKSVIDFGTGTAILAILASKLGASPIWAIDNDPWSLVNAEENIKVNHTEGILLEKCDNIKGRESVDIVLANLNLNIIEIHSEDMGARVKSGGKLILSGFLQEDTPGLLETFHGLGFFQNTSRGEGQWSSLLLTKE